jgi:NitT/TauT family transport system ATP-binding protein
MLSFANVGMTYQGSVTSVQALLGMEMQVGAGESVVMIGPSGCGKSTALLLASGLLQPTSGMVTVNDKTLVTPRLETALILQDFGLLPWKTVYDNAALGLVIRHFSKTECRERTSKALEQVALGDFARMYPGELSGGMRQRLALARALALDVDLLLMDEPLSALDTLLRENLQDTLLELWQARGYAQVLVTHSIEEAVFLGQRIMVMSSRPGHVMAEIENPQMGRATYRQNPAFYEKCNEVRALLKEPEKSNTTVDKLYAPLSTSDSLPTPDSLSTPLSTGETSNLTVSEGYSETASLANFIDQAGDVQ